MLWYLKLRGNLCQKFDQSSSNRNVGVDKRAKSHMLFLYCDEKFKWFWKKGMDFDRMLIGFSEKNTHIAGYFVNCLLY